MSEEKNKALNGSVDLLAQAMRQVFTEAVADGILPVQESMERMEGRLNEKIDKGLDTTNKNVQAQLAAHRKDIAGDMKKALAKR